MVDELALHDALNEVVTQLEDDDILTSRPFGVHNLTSFLTRCVLWSLPNVWILRLRRRHGWTELLQGANSLVLQAHLVGLTIGREHGDFSIGGIFLTFGALKAHQSKSSWNWARQGVLLITVDCEIAARCIYILNRADPDLYRFMQYSVNAYDPTLKRIMPLLDNSVDNSSRTTVSL